ncbi:FAD/NAD(P)-binding protein [Streptomyces sp. NPDC023723]|uniref:FAD/NAD(P)-binding protein n=1 Tax=Streptomyces sp. NPDC023723 TaxID=3154323 RepID=UPI003411BEC7
MTATRVHTLAIVGGGPRATYALERLSADLDRLGPDGRLRIHLFERSGHFGSGESHSPTQPTTSFLNRITSQVSFAADESVRGARRLRPARERPTLHEWCRRRFARTGEPDLDLGPDDWPRRYVHGLALQDMFHAYLRDLRRHPGVEVYLHHAEVADIQPRGRRLLVRITDGRCFPVDQALIVTGHTQHDPRRTPRTAELLAHAERTASSYVPYAYPLDRTLRAADTGSDRVVGVAGMGLTAIDVILHLTEGRGGRFLPDPAHGLCYAPSGAEPARLLAFSESGLFTFARPDNHKEADPARLEHQGVFLTTDAVDRLRAGVGVPGADGSGPRRLDFERDVLPLIVLEMAHVHYTTLFGPGTGAFLAAHTALAHRAFLAGGPPHGDRPHDPTRLLAPLEAAVDEVVEVLDSVLAGRVSQADAEAAQGNWPVGAALRRWTDVVLGPDSPLPGPDTARHSPWALETDPKGNRFSWERTVRPVLPSAAPTPEEYRAHVLAFMDRDQRWAAHGNLDNPHKAAADGVWRDLRAVISYAVDDGGLTADSHRDFLTRYVRLHNRLANGAAAEVMARVQALVRHGLLLVGAGQGAVVTPDPGTGRFRVDGPVTGVSCPVDTLVDARVHPFDPRRDAASLFRNLLRRGTVRLWRNTSATGEDFEPGGLDLDDRHRPVRCDGSVEERVTVLGPPAEGRKSFLLSALRPDADHYLMRETLTWLDDFWSRWETDMRGAGHTAAREAAARPVSPMSGWR